MNKIKYGNIEIPEDEFDGYLACEYCGKKDSTVVHTYCPFAKEIHNEKVPVVICDDCYHERCMDI